MESEIWKFRTRSGEYRVRVNGDFDEGADERLKSRVETIKKGVLEGADLKSTAFYAADSSSNNHAQHNRAHVMKHINKRKTNNHIRQEQQLL